MNKKSQGQNCNACDRTFANNKDLDKYIEAKHSQQICNFCEEVFNNESELKRHINLCDEYNKTTIKCNKCQKTFTRFGIKAHGEKCHGLQTSKLYACSECEYKAKSANDIRNHQAQEHTNAVYICDECGHKGSSANQIRNHQHKEHSTDEVEVSKEVCKHWRRGNCLKGNQCGFSHVGYQQTNPSTTSKASTTNRSPTCRHGENCSWMAKGNCRYYHKGVGVQKPAHQHQILSRKSDNKNSRMCHFNGRCTNSMCKYKHTGVQDFQSQRKHQGPTIRVIRNGLNSQ